MPKNSHKITPPQREWIQRFGGESLSFQRRYSDSSLVLAFIKAHHPRLYKAICEAVKAEGHDPDNHSYFTQKASALFPECVQAIRMEKIKIAKAHKYINGH